MEFEIEDSYYLHEKTQYDLISLPVTDANELTYDMFFKQFMLTNLPCLIKNVTTGWNCLNWISNNEPNIEYLQKKYGHTKVIIYDCNDRYLNSQKCKESSLDEYINYWRNERCQNKIYYLKDWHLKLQCKYDTFYDVPIFFASDWLNEYFVQCLDDDYRFVYMGPKDSWTPLHSDVFTSYSWSVNICGKKKWIFFPPGEEHFLKDNLNNLPYDVSEITHSRNHIKVIQNPGEAIFVPSGWYHQVWNLKDTISINHNWVNGCNVYIMWKSLQQHLKNIESEIQDCKDMENFEEHCQIMLNAITGIDYKKFYDFLVFIAQRRLEMLTNKSQKVLFHTHIIGTNHVYFDLKQIKNVLKDFLTCDISKTSYYSNGKHLLNKIVQELFSAS